MYIEHQNLSGQQNAQEYQSFFHEEFFLLFAALQNRFLLSVIFSKEFNFQTKLKLVPCKY